MVVLEHTQTYVRVGGFSLPAWLGGAPVAGFASSVAVPGCRRARTVAAVVCGVRPTVLGAVGPSAMRVAWPMCPSEQPCPPLG